MSFLDSVSQWLDPTRIQPQPVSPFAQYRYPHFVVRVPAGQRAPKQCTISAADGVAEFKRIYPYATAEECAQVSVAFAMGTVAIQILTAQ